MLVVVIGVGGVPVIAVHVVDVSVVVHGVVPAVRTMLMVVRLGLDVSVEPVTLIDMAVVDVVNMTIVQEVDVSLMLDGDVTTGWSVLVRVGVVDRVCAHGGVPRCGGRSEDARPNRDMQILQYLHTKVPRRAPFDVVASNRRRRQ